MKNLIVILTMCYIFSNCENDQNKNQANLNENKNVLNLDSLHKILISVKYKSEERLIPVVDTSYINSSIEHFKLKVDSIFKNEKISYNTNLKIEINCLQNIISQCKFENKSNVYIEFFVSSNGINGVHKDEFYPILYFGNDFNDTPNFRYQFFNENSLVKIDSYNSSFNQYAASNLKVKLDKLAHDNSSTEKIVLPLKNIETMLELFKQSSNITYPFTYIKCDFISMQHSTLIDSSLIFLNQVNLLFSARDVNNNILKGTSFYDLCNPWP